MSTNISRKKKENLINKIEDISKYLDENNANEELKEYLKEIAFEVKSNKFGLIFEEHNEKIDEKILKSIPVYTEEKSLDIDNGDNLNFLIESDNLAALTLLKKTHKEKVDYIYIDPPYNTKSKDFIYDDKYVDKTDDFKHSKWLSFMKKRLEIAHSLLKQDGCIMISINEEELCELKLLCNSIFGEDNYMTMFSVKVRHEDRILKGDKDFHEVLEYMLMYRKSSEFKTIKKLVDNTSNKDYVYEIIEKNDSPSIEIMDGKEVCVFKPGEYEINKVEASVENLKKINIRGSIKEGNSSGRFFMKHLNQFIGINKGYLYKVPNMGDDKFGYRYFLIPNKDNRANGDYFQGVPLNRKEFKEVPYANYLDFEYAFNNVGYEGNVEFRNGKKPLDFLEKCLEMGGVKQNKEAIILDFFAGSGSTGHAVMKMNEIDGGKRKFILVTNSQNEICREVTYKRLSSVINEDNLDESLKFYKVEFVDIEGKIFLEYLYELLDHIVEMIQIENHANLQKNISLRIIKEEKGIENLNLEENIEKIYVGPDVLIDQNIKNKIIRKGIEINAIPQKYYSEMI